MATPSYPGTRPSGNANEVRVYQTPAQQTQKTSTRTGTTLAKKSSSAAMWWILAAIALAIILYFALRR